MNKLKFGSLFTGVGGFDLGFERAGMECAWQVENDKYCIKVLERRFPNVRRYEDVKEVGRNNLESVDLICGGFPCQDLSVAGKRTGLSGKRSGLWFEFERIIAEIKPKWVVVENVPGLLSSDNGRDFGIILKSLDEFGYGVAWRVLDSQYFGVAQRRKRVFVVASFGNISCAKVLFEQEGMSGDIEKGEEERKEIAASAISSSGKHGFGEIVGALQARDLKGVGNQYVNEGKCIISPECENHSYWDGGQISDTLDVAMLTKGQMMPEKRRMPAVIETNETKSATTRIQMNAEKSVTLSGHAGGMGGKTGLYFYENMGVRRLTPTECCRLQGFTDDWNEYGLSDIIDVEISLGDTLCQLVQSMDVKEKLLTVIQNCASCTISDGESGVTQALHIQNIERTPENVKLKIAIDLLIAGNGVCDTINHGKTTATRCKQKEILRIEKRIECQGVPNTALLLRMTLAENLPAKRLSTISTWIEEILEEKIYTFLIRDLNIISLTQPLTSVSRNSCKRESLYLRMGSTTQISDTQRYKQMGNAVTVNVIEWIGKRIVDN